MSWNSQEDQIRLDYEDINASFLPKGYEVILVISITSQHASPIYAICHLNTKWYYGYDFKLLKVVYEIPNIIDYQQ